MFVSFGFEIQCWSSMVILIMIMFCMLRDILFRQIVNENRPRQILKLGWLSLEAKSWLSCCLGNDLGNLWIVWAFFTYLEKFYPLVTSLCHLFIVKPFFFLLLKPIILPFYEPKHLTEPLMRTFICLVFIMFERATILCYGWKRRMGKFPYLFIFILLRWGQ